jgi:DNA-binding NtrC family response regulator
MNTMASTSAESVLSGHHAWAAFSPDCGAPTVMIATVDSKVREALTGILEGYGIEIEPVKGVEAAKGLLAVSSVSACLCGFGLEDGTYKDLVKHAKRQTPEVPVVIVSTPSCANEYREYLAAMNAGAFDFLCYPYQTHEVERILRLAVSSSRRVAR